MSSSLKIVSITSIKLGGKNVFISTVLVLRQASKLLHMLCALLFSLKWMNKKSSWKSEDINTPPVKYAD